MSAPLDDYLAPQLAARREQGLYRQRSLRQSPQTARVTVDGQRCLNFSSNDYLGLAHHPRVVSALQAAATQWGAGSGASHLIHGHAEPHHALEEAIARWTGRERALLFSTGYMANLGTITALVGKGDGVFEDRLNHASLLDGGLLSGARFQRFAHNDVDHLSRALQRSKVKQRLIVVDGVFSMDGDLAPLPALAALAREQNAWLMVDDAHGLGCLGATGAGTLEYFGLGQADVPILMGTLGKALGGFGAFVAGSEVLIESLIQFARPYIYTTAMPPAVAASVLEALQVLQDESWRRQRLRDRIDQFRAGAETLGLALMPSETAIQPVVLGCPERVMGVAQTLAQQGFLVGAVRPPTVPVGSARLRITLSADHEAADIDALLVALAATCQSRDDTGSQQ